MSESRGDKLIARARAERLRRREAINIKPNKRIRRIWSTSDYTKILTHTEGFTQTYAERLVRLLFSVLQRALLRGDVVVLPGVGRMYIVYMASREVDNHCAIPDAARVLFRTSATLQKLIRPKVKYYIRFNDHPVATRPDDELPEGECLLDVEKFVVEQGWEDESGRSLEEDA
jgi:nucleoid DNA-binding protein